MQYDLSINKDLISLQSQLLYFKEKQSIVEFKEVKQTRSNLQNRALHLFFAFICQELNNLGITFNYTGIKWMPTETRYTELLVKETIWRPIQMTLFNIESTKDIGSNEINEIAEVIIKHFADKGIELSFPSQFNKYLETLKQYEH